MVFRMSGNKSTSFRPLETPARGGFAVARPGDDRWPIRLNISTETAAHMQGSQRSSTDSAQSANSIPMSGTCRQAKMDALKDLQSTRREN